MWLLWYGTANVDWGLWDVQSSEVRTGRVASAWCARAGTRDGTPPRVPAPPRLPRVDRIAYAVRSGTEQATACRQFGHEFGSIRFEIVGTRATPGTSSRAITI